MTCDTGSALNQHWFHVLCLRKRSRLVDYNVYARWLIHEWLCCLDNLRHWVSIKPTSVQHIVFTEKASTRLM